MNTATPTIATHSGTFHADDVFGVGILMGVFPSHTLVRTRKQELIDAADFAVDVGGTWDATKGRFDHHQRGFDGARPAREKFATPKTWRTRSATGTQASADPRTISMRPIFVTTWRTSRSCVAFRRFRTSLEINHGRLRPFSAIS